MEAGHLHATLGVVWILSTAADESLRDVDATEAYLIEALERDRSAATELVKSVEDFARRTGRSQELCDVLDRLAREGEVDARTVRLTRARDAVRKSLR